MLVTRAAWCAALAIALAAWCADAAAPIARPPLDVARIAAHAIGAALVRNATR